MVTSDRGGMARERDLDDAEWRSVYGEPIVRQEDVAANIGLVGGNNVERPNLTGNPNDGPKTPAEWFNTAAFALPAQFTFGNAGRNVVVGRGLTNLDLSLQKDWALRENQAIEFRFDTFNTLNHPNFNLPEPNLWRL